MTGGIRAEVRVTSPDDCPISRLTAETSAESTSISRTAVPGTPDVIEEFEVDGDVEVDDAVLGTRTENVFSYGSTDVYRFSRRHESGCACEAIEALGCPIVDAHARDGILHLAFHVPDMETLSEAVAALRARYGSVGMERLVRSDVDHGGHDLVFVDRGTLTARQLETLTTAHEMGYFDHPKGANAGEVAEALGISTSTFTEHLSAAQSKLLADVLGSY